MKDETDQMHLDVGIWKSLVYTPPPEVDKPTYEIVGPTERYDCRDQCYARIAMEKGTPAYEDYYSRHPEKKNLMKKIGSGQKNRPQSLY